MKNKVFRRLSDSGHATIFSSRVSGGIITLELMTYTKNKIFTTLSKEDAIRFAIWLLVKCHD